MVIDVDKIFLCLVIHGKVERKKLKLLRYKLSSPLFKGNGKENLSIFFLVFSLGYVWFQKGLRK